MGRYVLSTAAVARNDVVWVRGRLQHPLLHQTDRLARDVRL